MKQGKFSGNLGFYLLTIFMIFVAAFSPIKDGGDEINIDFPIEKISLLAGNSQTIPFTITNNSTNSIKIIKVEIVHGSGLSIDEISLLSYFLNPLEMTDGSFKLTSTETATSSGQVSLMVEYEFTPPDSSTSINHKKFAPVDFDIIPYPNPDELLLVSIHSEDNSIIEGNLKSVTLELNNLSPFSISIDQISFLNSGYIVAYPEKCIYDLTKIKNACETNDLLLSPLTIESGRSILVPIYLNLAQSYPHRNIQSFFIFNLSFQWGEIQRTSQFNIEYMVDASSFAGEKSILTLFGVPIYLLLPGFIFLTIYQSLRRTNSLFNDNKPIFWIATIIASLFIQFLYKKIAIPDGYRGDLLSDFNTKDLLCISIFSALMGCFIAIVSRLIRSMKTPSQKDTPMKVIRKILFMNLSYSLPSFTIEDEPGMYFEISRHSDSDSSILWYCPPIAITPLEKEDNRNGNLEGRKEKKRSLVEKWVNKSSHPMEQKNFFVKFVLVCELLIKSHGKEISIDWKYNRVNYLDPSKKKISPPIENYLFWDGEL